VKRSPHPPGNFNPFCGGSMDIFWYCTMNGLIQLYMYMYIWKSQYRHWPWSWSEPVNCQHQKNKGSYISRSSWKHFKRSIILLVQFKKSETQLFYGKWTLYMFYNYFFIFSQLSVTMMLKMHSLLPLRMQKLKLWWLHLRKKQRTADNRWKNYQFSMLTCFIYTVQVSEFDHDWKYMYVSLQIM